MPASLDRREFLSRGLAFGAGLAAIGGGGALLTACGSSSSSSASTTTAGGASTTAGGSPTTATAANFGALDYQLSWVKNVEFAGQYYADTNGYYAGNGFSSVSLVSGGPNVDQDAVVAAGKALVGISSPDITGPAIANGANTVIIAALFQKNPFAMMSLASKPIPNPQAMIGKKIGIQSVNTAVFNSFLKANNLSPSQMTIVPVQFDPTPLTTGEVDAWFSFITNEPNLLKAKGFDTVTWLLNDYNYPLVSQVYVVQKSSLQSKRDELKALLRSDIMGWHEALKNPGGGATLAVKKYGPSLGLDVAEQTLESTAQNQLILTDRTKVDGIMTVTPDMITQNIHTLALGGTSITAEQLFDMSVLTEVYNEHPELKTSPV